MTGSVLKRTGYLDRYAPVSLPAGQYDAQILSVGVSHHRALPE